MSAAKLANKTKSAGTVRKWTVWVALTNTGDYMQIVLDGARPRLAQLAHKTRVAFALLPSTKLSFSHAQTLVRMQINVWLPLACFRDALLHVK